MPTESERQFIGDILGDDTSEYDQESPRDKVSDQPETEKLDIEK